MRRLVLALFATTTTACAFGPRVPHPASVDQGLLLVRVSVEGALFRKSIKNADSAEIVELDEKGVPVPGKRARSRFMVNGYVVFFGLPAGRYMLRSASFPARGVRYGVDIPEQVQAKTSVVLPRGSVAFLGDYTLDSHWPEFSVGIVRAARIVAHWLTPFLARPRIPRETGSPIYDAEARAETAALHAVRESLSGTLWSRVVDARLRALGAAEKPKETGAIRSRVLPLKEEPFLSWRDTLDWGEPRRAADGIAWRRPGGSAQIAVFFTTAAAPGFKGWDAAVSDLRRSASASVEDSGVVYEVGVATRVGPAARTTKYVYPEGVLVGSETTVLLTETVLVPDGYGLFTARLRASRGEFSAALPLFREFLKQLVLGPPPPPPPPKQEAVLPFIGGSQ